MIARVACSLLCSAAALVAFPIHAGKTQPFDLGIHIVYSEEHGEEDLRRQLEATLLADLEREACFRSVTILDSVPDHETEKPDLLVRMVISNVEEKSRFGANIAQLSNPDRTPDVDQMVVVETEASFSLNLSSRAEDLALRSRRFNETAAYRPRMNEDPRLASWDELIRSTSRTTRRFLCKGSIEKDLRRAAR